MNKVRFSDVLTIINGRNQKRVENPNGKYPIYGSGGIMGYADDYICDKETVVIGRKGNINNPIYVETPFGMLIQHLDYMQMKRNFSQNICFIFVKSLILSI